MWRYAEQFESAQSASRTLTWLRCCRSYDFLLLLRMFQKLAASCDCYGQPCLWHSLVGCLSSFLPGGIVNNSVHVSDSYRYSGLQPETEVLLLNRYNDLHAAGLSVRDTVIPRFARSIESDFDDGIDVGVGTAAHGIGRHLPGNEIQSPWQKSYWEGLITSTHSTDLSFRLCMLCCREKRKKHELLNEDNEKGTFFMHTRFEYGDLCQ